jgi:hypothetical protein
LGHRASEDFFDVRVSHIGGAAEQAKFDLRGEILKDFSAAGE